MSMPTLLFCQLNHDRTVVSCHRPTLKTDPKDLSFNLSTCVSFLNVKSYELDRNGNIVYNSFS